MLRANISKEQSIEENLNTWCYEVGTVFEEVNIQAAQEFIALAQPDGVIELGCGDGASLRVFKTFGIPCHGVDINRDKVDACPEGTASVISDMLNLLRLYPSNSIKNIYTHHALEHCVHADLIIEEIARVIVPGGFFYCIVPAGDYLHSVHHVVFEDLTELIPTGMVPMLQCVQTRNEPEFKVLAWKPLTT